MGVPLPTELDTPGWYFLAHRPTLFCWVLVLSWHGLKKHPIKWSSLYTTTNCRLYMYTNYIFIQWLTKIRQNMFQANDEYKWLTWYGLFLHEQLSKRQVLRWGGGYSSMIWVGSDLKSRPIFIPNFAEKWHPFARATNLQKKKKKKKKKFTLFSKIFKLYSKFRKFWYQIDKIGPIFAPV